MITGGSDGMGKAVACQLAAKGANVEIVARTVPKLEAALDAVKVGRMLLCFLRSMRLILLTGFRFAPHSTKIPLHQRRLDQSHGLRADH